MKGILKEICSCTLSRVEGKMKTVPLEEVKRQALAAKGRGYAFANALRGEHLQVIAEVKKASPSKGVIDEQFNYLAIARDYAEGGAAAISCLTEPKYFLGSDKIFCDIRAQVSVPMLRKDFILTEYQVYESALLGADCILLIMTALEPYEAQRLFETARSLGLEALFECRNEEHIERAQSMGAKIIGINNRNLADFSVDAGRAARYRKLVDKSNIFVSESGVMSVEDAAAQRAAGADAMLVGEYLMRSQDRRQTLRQLTCIK